ncbi:MAG TPA: hypothetical protein VII98_14775 [Solirubrobacteraceae bacterium]
MIARAAALAGAAVVLALGLTACETTQDTSKRLSKQGQALLKGKTFTIATANPDIKVTSTAVLQDPNGTAAVVELKNGGAAQADVPVLISVSGAKGKQLYTNAAPGLDPSLVQLAAVPKGQSEIWVNDQVTATGKPKSLKATIGLAKGKAPATLPQMTITKLAFGSDVSGVYARGTITNTSKVAQKRLVVACVSTSGAKVRAAGRAIVDNLAPAPTPKPITFRVYFIGNPKGGKLACSAPPTVFAGG